MKDGKIWEVTSVAPLAEVWTKDGSERIAQIGDDNKDYSDDSNCDELERFAYLISASQEMYAACKSLEAPARKIIADCEKCGKMFEQNWGDALNQARLIVAAIDKAESAQ